MWVIVCILVICDHWLSWCFKNQYPLFFAASSSCFLWSHFIIFLSLGLNDLAVKLLKIYEDFAKALTYIRTMNCDLVEDLVGTGLCDSQYNLSKSDTLWWCPAGRTKAAGAGKSVRTEEVEVKRVTQTQDSLMKVLLCPDRCWVLSVWLWWWCDITWLGIMSCSLNVKSGMSRYWKQQWCLR